MSSDIKFTGYDPDIEPLEDLQSAAIDYDFEQFLCSGDMPDTRDIMQLMIDNKIREDQFRMNSCAGFGTVHGGSTTFWLSTGVWRAFNPHWTYRKGQARDRIKGDRGATIHNVVESGKIDGLLVQDVENDGRKEFPFPRDQYDFQYPPQASEIAAKRKIGYSAVLRSYQACLNFLQAGQGAIVIGGPWGNWSPDRNGICRRFAGGGGGHARAYVDWKKIGSDFCLVEANSHFESYGDDGFGYHTPEFVDAQFRDGRFVAIGISDIALGPGDKPKQRPHRRYVKLV
jgi:hypothetical protein